MPAPLGSRNTVSEAMQAGEPFPWERLLDALRVQHPELYRAWFAELRSLGVSSGELRILVTDPTQAAYLRDQCTSAFVGIANLLSGYLLPVRFVTTVEDEPAIEPAPPPTMGPGRLSPDYTFDQFVVGPSNRLAHAACRAVCSQPGTLYNPLFVHGASGLGKTHLLQATCTDMRRMNPAAKCVYMSCETFVNEFIRAIEHGRLPEFRDAAREADVLAIDDVQFLANRESSQEELFHTFNVLYQNRRQIILSADARPSDIPTLEDRLVSRFNWGLVAQIDPPNRETRHAILQKKARLRGCEVPDEVLDYIAQRVEDNIRVLEGALTKLISERQIGGRPLTIDTARQVLDDFQGAEPKPVHVSHILQAVSQYYGIKLSDLIGRKRSRSVVFPRQVAMYLARKLTPLSLEEIGNHVGGRDHSTVLHAERTVEASRSTDVKTAETLARLTRQLLARP